MKKSFLGILLALALSLGFDQGHTNIRRHDQNITVLVGSFVSIGGFEDLQVDTSMFTPAPSIIYPHTANVMQYQVGVAFDYTDTESSTTQTKEMLAEFIVPATATGVPDGTNFYLEASMTGATSAGVVTLSHTPQDLLTAIPAQHIATDGLIFTTIEIDIDDFNTDATANYVISYTVANS